MIDLDPIRERFAVLSPHLDERERRLLAAVEARTCGYGGIAAVSLATGIAVSTIGRGLKDLAGETALAPGHVRRSGGGCKPVLVVDAELWVELMALVEPGERGYPMWRLRWTCKSLAQLAAELTARGHPISRTNVGALLRQQKFSLQGNCKTREGGDLPGRDAQFLHINQSVTAALAAQQPVIAVDTKKKELVGDFKNAGREWRPQGDPEEVQVYDFLSKAFGRAVPYGIYDIACNAGWVGVGMNHDTSAFAVQTIRRWWQEVGCKRYPDAKCLTITCDGGGSNGSRVRLWKRELQGLANELGIDITVHHLPPGTSKWNKIEHRLFSFISMNWRAQPLVSYRVIVDLISATTTKTGLTVRCELDANTYPKGIVVSDQDMAGINITRDAFHGEWNYTIHPSHQSIRAVNSG